MQPGRTLLQLAKQVGEEKGKNLGGRHGSAPISTVTCEQEVACPQYAAHGDEAASRLLAARGGSDDCSF